MRAVPVKSDSEWSSAVKSKAGVQKALVIGENIPPPFDRLVWQEATKIQEIDYVVSIICPKGDGCDASYECLNGIHIYRHSLPLEADGALGYLLGCSAGLFWEFDLAFKVLYRLGFNTIHACNPRGLIFVVGGFFKFFGEKSLFDHHSIYERSQIALFLSVKNKAI